MHASMCAAALTAIGLGSLYGPCALADDSVPITVTNDNTDDVIISLYDINTTPRSKLLSHQRINGFASIPLSVTAGADGTGHVYWTAVTADPGTRKCGRKDKPGLQSDASVHVYAKSDCPAK
jgi:hypothetical protein